MLGLYKELDLEKSSLLSPGFELYIEFDDWNIIFPYLRAARGSILKKQLCFYLNDSEGNIRRKGKKYVACLSAPWKAFRVDVYRKQEWIRGLKSCVGLVSM